MRRMDKESTHAKAGESDAQLKKRHAESDPSDHSANQAGTSG